MVTKPNAITATDSNVGSTVRLTGKKAKLLELLRSGQSYTTEEKIAILDTTKTNLYKMTCELRKDGLIGAKDFPKSGPSGIGVFFDSVHEMHQQPRERNLRISGKSIRTRAFELLEKKTPDLKIAMTLDISGEEVFSLKKEYLRLTASDSLCRAFEEIEDGEFQYLLDLIARRKAQKMPWKKFMEIVDCVPILEYIHANYNMWKNKVDDAERRFKERESALQDLDHKISEAKEIYEYKNSFNNKLAGRIVDKENQTKRLDEKIGRKHRVIRDLEQTPLYLNIKQFVEQKVQEMSSDPAAIAQLSIDSMLDLIKENSGMSIIEDYAYNAQVPELEPELRKKARARAQSKLEQRLRSTILNQAEKQADMKSFS